MLQHPSVAQLSATFIFDTTTRSQYFTKSTHCGFKRPHPESQTSMTKAGNQTHVAVPHCMACRRRIKSLRNCFLPRQLVFCFFFVRATNSLILQLSNFKTTGEIRLVQKDDACQLQSTSLSTSRSALH